VTLASGHEVQLERRADGLWGVVRLTRDVWQPVRSYEVVRTPTPLLLRGTLEYELELDGAPAQRIRAQGSTVTQVMRSFEHGTFGIWRDGLYLGHAPGTPLPAAATLRVRLDTGAVDAQGYELFEGRRFSGRGLGLWSGQHAERVLDVPADRVLTFGTASEPASPLDPPDATRVFRVRVDGNVVFEHAQPADPAGRYDWHRVALPAGSARRVRFEVDGPFAYTAFVDPVLAPAERGSYASRPWRAPPSLVVFLADTFRADNLASYGGPAGYTPELDRFAAESLRFERAWSAGTFTLPGHSALFSGLYPRQTSSDAIDTALSDEVETIAERLARAGYRTGAITDSALVSMRYGLHQGFQWFDECDIDLTSTLERARRFLDADDGRPVFLFVQTYRTHLPYGEHELPAVAGRPNMRGSEEYQRLMGALQALGGPEAAFEREPERARAIGRELHELYRLGARDLDRAFGLFRRDLEARGFPAAGYLVFTSDHGEAFFEHGQFAHQGHVFEEQVRVPLLVAGPGVAPRSVPHAASLIDLAPTFGACAGLEPRRDWPGTNLLALDEERELYAFECAQGERSTVALLTGARKLIALEEPAARRLREPWRAFELTRDPGEERDLLSSDETWPRALFEDARARVEAVLVPLVTPAAAALDPDRIEELGALGYATDGDG
jgi:arylsulfatase